MSQQALNVRRSLRIIRRRKALVGIIAAVGLLAGCAFTVLRPPMLESQALVVLPSSPHLDTATEVVIAASDPVLASALPRADPAMSLETLRARVRVTSLTSTVLSISAKGLTAAEAEDTANAVADSYIAYITAANSPAGQLHAHLLESAANATGAGLPSRLIVTGLLGALLGALIGAIVAIGISRSDRRMRERDEIAASIGVPVLASVSSGHPSGAAGWTKLLENYQPQVVQAWSLRNALHHLGLADIDLASFRGGRGASLAVLSLSSDPGALALGPQLAVFAASLRIPTVLVMGPQQDPNATATLRAACTAMQAAPSGHPDHLNIMVRDDEDIDRQPDAALKIVVSVVDGRAPRVADTMRTTVTVLAVSAGVVTAEQLARVAVSAAADGRVISGIFVADPDPADRTTGRVPQSARPAVRRSPTRLTRTTAETRR